MNFGSGQSFDLQKLNFKWNFLQLKLIRGGEYGDHVVAAIARQRRFVVFDFAVGASFDETVIVRRFQYDQTHRLLFQIVDEE